MMRTTSWVAAALTIAACGKQSQDPAQPYREAMPKAAVVQLGTPKAEGTAAGVVAGLLPAEAPSRTAQAPSYGSEYAAQSYWMATTVNVGVWWTLELVKLVTAYPPSACDDASCTWGPWLGDNGLNYYKMHVARAGGGFDWALSGQSAAVGTPPWKDLLAGHAVPGRDRDHGSGDFQVLFDNFDWLQHATTTWKNDYGTLSVSYDNNTGLVIDVTAVGAHDDDPDPARHGNTMNAAYSFDLTSPDGDLQVGFKDVTAGDQATLHTRWKRLDGAGRGDAHYVGAGGTPVYDASECWNGAGATLPWAKVYDTKIAFGAEVNCAYAPAANATIGVPQ